jgi:uncharacterized membrane protein YgdD (TMEM256/DUF423 family)
MLRIIVFLFFVLVHVFAFCFCKVTEPAASCLFFGVFVFVGSLLVLSVENLRDTILRLLLLSFRKQRS